MAILAILSANLSNPKLKPFPATTRLIRPSPTYFLVTGHISNHVSPVILPSPQKRVAHRPDNLGGTQPEGVVVNLSDEGYLLLHGDIAQNRQKLEILPFCHARTLPAVSYDCVGLAIWS